MLPAVIYLDRRTILGLPQKAKKARNKNKSSVSDNQAVGAVLEHYCDVVRLSPFDCVLICSKRQEMFSRCY